MHWLVGTAPRSALSGLPGAFAVRVWGWLCGAPRGGWAAPYGHVRCGVQAAVLTIARSPQVSHPLPRVW